MLSKKRFLAILAVLSLLLVVGCSGDGEEFSQETLNLRLTEESESEVNVEKMEFGFEDVDAVEVELTNQDDSNDTLSDSKKDLDGKVEDLAFSFDKLRKGANYEIDIVARDNEGYDIYQGDYTVNIDKESNVTVEMEFLAAEGITFEIENIGENVDSGKVILLPEEHNKDADIDLEQEAATAEFDSLPANWYESRIKLYDEQGEKIYDKQSKGFKVLPARTARVNVDLDQRGDDGKLIVDVTWELAPDDPEITVKADEENETIELNWGEVADSQGYFVYRGESPDAKIPLDTTNENETEYIDDEIEIGTTYYYWVRAVGDNGLNSSFSNRADASIDEEVDGITIYVKSNSAPDIWAWEVNGNAITENRGYTWPGEEMEEATSSDMNNPDDWYKYEIASDELQGGLEIQLKLNGEPDGEDVPGYKLPNSETAWYELDNNKWHDEDPTQTVGPTEASISISPNTETYTEDTTL